MSSHGSFNGTIGYTVCVRTRVCMWLEPSLAKEVHCVTDNVLVAFGNAATVKNHTVLQLSISLYVFLMELLFIVKISTS